jgi:2-methylisocitrate lyase-like PEP mutase family enzyme
MMLGHLRELVNATSLPVNADYQNGYAERPEDVAGNVKLCVTTGVAGLSIEDATRGSVLYERQLAIERVKAARRAIDESELPVVLTARCEVSAARDPNPLKVAVDRLVAFAEAGADCLYAPFISDPDAISEIVRAVAPKPVNVLVWRPGLTVTQLADLGVRRISVGSALSRVAWNAFSAAAKEILTVGSFEGFAGTASGPDLNDLFSRLV